MDDLAAAVITKTSFHFSEFIQYDLKLAIAVCQYSLIVVNGPLQVPVFSRQLVPLEPSESLQSHSENATALTFR